MAVLIPTEAATTALAQSRTKDALRMLEKGMHPDFVATTTGVYTASPDNWDHIVMNEMPGKIYINPGSTVREAVRDNSIKNYMPMLLDLPIKTKEKYEDPDQLGRYNQLDEMLGLYSDIAAKPTLDHELTHAARLKNTPANKNRINADRMDTERKEERRAKVAEQTAYASGIEDAVAALNKMYNVKQVDRNTYKGALPTEYQIFRRMSK